MLLCSKNTEINLKIQFFNQNAKIAKKNMQNITKKT